MSSAVTLRGILDDEQGIHSAAAAVAEEQR
jgi:hypothetical protein